MHDDAKQQDSGREGGERPDDVIDIEEFSKAGKKPPPSKHYRIKIDRTPYVVNVPSMTGLELLILAGKQPPSQFALYEKIHGGGNRKIEPTETVSFTKPGVERFMTLPLDQTEG